MASLEDVALEVSEQLGQLADQVAQHPLGRTDAGLREVRARANGLAEALRRAHDRHHERLRAERDREREEKRQADAAAQPTHPREADHRSPDASARDKK